MTTFTITDEKLNLKKQTFLTLNDFLKEVYALDAMPVQVGRIYDDELSPALLEKIKLAESIPLSEYTNAQ